MKINKTEQVQPCVSEESGAVGARRSNTTGAKPGRQGRGARGERRVGAPNAERGWRASISLTAPVRALGLFASPDTPKALLVRQV